MRRLLQVLAVCGGLLIAASPTDAVPNFPLFFQGTYCAYLLQCDAVRMRFNANGTVDARLTVLGSEYETDSDWTWDPNAQQVTLSGPDFNALLDRSGDCLSGSGTWDLVILGIVPVDLDVCRFTP